MRRPTKQETYLKIIAKSAKYSEVVSVMNLALFVYLTGALISYTYLQNVQPSSGTNLLAGIIIGGILAAIVIIGTQIALPRVLFPKDFKHKASRKKT